MKKAGSFLDGCKVFLSGFSEPEQMQLARVLEYSGGVRLTKLVESVTHCVHSVGTNTVVPDTSKLLEQLDLSPHMFSIQWMVESMLLTHIQRGREEESSFAVVYLVRYFDSFALFG